MNIVMLPEKLKYLITSWSSKGFSREQLGSAGTEVSGVRSTDLQRAASDKKKITVSIGFWYELDQWLDLQVGLGLIVSLFVPGFTS